MTLNFDFANYVQKCKGYESFANDLQTELNKHLRDAECTVSVTGSGYVFIEVIYPKLLYYTYTCCCSIGTFGLRTDGTISSISDYVLDKIKSNLLQKFFRN